LDTPAHFRKVKQLEQTSSEYPSQWQGHLEDGRMFYIRYRWGNFTVRVSVAPTNDLDDVFIPPPIYQEQIGKDDGILEQDEMLELTKDLFIWSL